MYVKVHERKFFQNGREVVRHITALCDASLLGKVFEEGDLILDLKKHRPFYEGEHVGVPEATVLLQQAKNLNVVGKKSVALAQKVLKIPPSQVRQIGGVPHVQVFYV